MEAIVIVNAIALLQYMYFSMMVGKARGAHDVKAPATIGHPVFERHFRVQQNTVEQLLVFVPSLWVFGYYVDALIGAALGLVFIVGRFMYAHRYVSDPSRRGPGFIIGFFASLILLLGGLIGAIVALF